MITNFDDNKIEKGEILQVLMATAVIILIFTLWGLL